MSRRISGGDPRRSLIWGRGELGKAVSAAQIGRDGSLDRQQMIELELLGGAQALGGGESLGAERGDRGQQRRRAFEPVAAAGSLLRGLGRVPITEPGAEKRGPAGERVVKDCRNVLRCARDRRVRPAVTPGLVVRLLAK